jgi:hypothetical protein
MTSLVSTNYLAVNILSDWFTIFFKLSKHLKSFGYTIVHSSKLFQPALVRYLKSHHIIYNDVYSKR